MQNVLKKEETIVNSTTRSENIQIRDQPIWEIKKICNVPINSGLHLPLLREKWIKFSSIKVGYLCPWDNGQIPYSTI